MLNPHHSLPPAEPMPTRRSVLMPMLVALAGVSIVSAYLYWGKMTRIPPRVSRIGTLAYTGNDGHGSYTDPSDATTPGWSSLMATDPQQLLAVHPGDRALLPAEAVLVPHPHAQHFMGVRRTAEGLTEELVFYRVPGIEAQAVRQHCRNAALAAGFAAQPGGTSKDTDLYTRAYAPASDRPAVEQTLIVRVTTRGDAVRTIVWIRYAMTPRK